MKRYDPEEIVDNLRAAETSPQKVFLQDNSPSTLAQRATREIPQDQTDNPPAPVKPENVSVSEPVFSAPPPEPIQLPEIPSHFLSSQVLPLLEESVDVARVPPGTRWGFLKRLVQRALRIITGKQVNFNRSAANAIHLWLDHGQKVDKALSQILAHLRARDSVLTLMEERFGDINRTHDSLIKGVQEAIQKTLETREGIQEANQKIHEVHQRIDNSNRATQEMNAEAQAARGRLELGIQDTNQKIHEVHQRISDSDRAIQEMNAEAQAARGRLELGIQDTNQKIHKVHQRISDSDRAIQEMNAEAQAARGRLELGIQDTNQKIHEVHQRISDSDRAIQEMNAEVEAVQRRVDETLQAAGQVRELGEEMRRETEARMRRMLHLIHEELRSTAMDGAPLSPKRRSESGIAASVSRASAEALCEDLSYLLYEERWRGPKDLIRKWQEDYVRLIEPHLNTLPPDKRRVLDVGCGRGEFLALLNEYGIAATGVEINEACANLAREDGLEVQSADALTFLEAQPDGTFGAIVAFQVVEHLPPAVLRRFLDLVRTKLAPGGICVLETLNPGSFSAYRWYFMDPTHKAFLAPETLRLLCECAGLEHSETRMIHPIPEHERLVPAGEEAERENVERLNNLLFGCQDYYIMLRKKEERLET